jgi:DNA repair photolyase
MTPTKLGGADFTCNPYRGCTHGCLYCYVKTLAGYVSETRRWGSYVDHRAFQDYAIPKGTGSKQLIFSSATDSYQPIEATIRETRAVLEAIVESDLRIQILTKSDLVLRDLDLFKQMKNVEVGMSIACEDADARWLEPGATLPSKRLEALRVLKREGIRTYAFIAPIIPGVTNVESWISRLKGVVDYFMFDTLNVGDPTNRRELRSALERYRPDAVVLFEDTFEHHGKFYIHTRRDIVRLCAEADIPLGYLFSGGSQ